MSYYGDAQWPASAGAQPTAWDHQTPPTRSGLPPNTSLRASSTSRPIDNADPGASSTIPREEPSAAFWNQFEEVDRAIENLVKSGKLFGPPGGRREFPPSFPPGPARLHPDFDPRGPGGPQRTHSIEFDGRSGPPSSNLQNFYASQRHQSSRGSNDAEQMIQHKRRMAAQRERELRNYHQEQQFNRTGFTEMQLGGPGPGPGPGPAPVNANPSSRPDRTLSPGGMSEEARRELIARQRNALYGEGPFGEAAGYIDETGAPRQGLPAHHGGPANMRGPSPLAYEYGRNAPAAHPDAGSQSAVDSTSIGLQQRERTSSNASPQSNPQSNPTGPKGPLEQANRTSNSSPGGGSSQNGKPPAGKTVAPIGTRPSAGSSTQGPTNPALTRQSTTPLPSPLNHGYNAPGGSEATTSSAGAPNPTSATASGTDSSSTGTGSGTGLSGWGQRAGWGNKTQTSVWG